MKWRLFFIRLYTGRCSESALIIFCTRKSQNQESRKVRDEWVGALCDEKEQSARNLYGLLVKWFPYSCNG